MFTDFLKSLNFYIFGSNNASFTLHWANYEFSVGNSHLYPLLVPGIRYNSHKPNE